MDTGINRTVRKQETRNDSKMEVTTRKEEYFTTVIFDQKWAFTLAIFPQNNPSQNTGK